MNNCSHLYLISSIACQLSECLSKDELELLAADLKALGETREVVSVQNNMCNKNEL